MEDGNWPYNRLASSLHRGARLTVSEGRARSHTRGQTRRAQGGHKTSNAAMGDFHATPRGEDTPLERGALSARTVHIKGSRIRQRTGELGRVVAGRLNEPGTSAAQRANQIRRRGRNVAASHPKRPRRASAMTTDDIDGSQPKEDASGREREKQKNREQSVITEHEGRIASRTASEQ